MAYIFRENELPSLIDAKQARERIFFVNKDLAKIDDMLAGVMPPRISLISRPAFMIVLGD